MERDSLLTINETSDVLRISPCYAAWLGFPRQNRLREDQRLSSI